MINHITRCQMSMLGTHICFVSHWVLDSLTHWRQDKKGRRHFADDMFKCIFLNENVWILINIALKFVPKDQINNIPALVQIKAWRQPGDKPLSEPMMFSLRMHIWVTRPQWVNWYIYVCVCVCVCVCVSVNRCHIDAGDPYWGRQFL